MYAGDVGEVREACRNKHRFQGGVFCMSETRARREKRAATNTAFRAVFFCMPETRARREKHAATNTAFRAVFVVCRRCRHRRSELDIVHYLLT